MARPDSHGSMNLLNPPDTDFAVNCTGHERLSTLQEEHLSHLHPVAPPSGEALLVRNIPKGNGSIAASGRHTRHPSGRGLGGGVYVDPSVGATMDMQTLIAGNQASTSNNDIWGTITMAP
jgi:hypothetical protein